MNKVDKVIEEMDQQRRSAGGRGLVASAMLAAMTATVMAMVFTTPAISPAESKGTPSTSQNAERIDRLVTEGQQQRQQIKQLQTLLEYCLDPEHKNEEACMTPNNLNPQYVERILETRYNNDSDGDDDDDDSDDGDETPAPARRTPSPTPRPSASPETEGIELPDVEVPGITIPKVSVPQVPELLPIPDLTGEATDE